LVQNTLILVVDDDIPLLETTAYMLENLGHQIVMAKDGVEAVEVYKTTKPNLTLMDVKMPKQDGFDAFFKIIESDPEAKVILITAYHVDEKKFLKAKSMNLLDYIEKPYDVDKLEEMIKKHLTS
jgi:two-component system chemotaxis response regulator CheY